jgi:hypothetical protein
MASATKACKTCGGETKVTTLGAFRGESGPVALMVSGMPAVVCAQGHKRFLSPRFVAALMDFVSDAEEAAPQPPATQRGLFRKRFHCHSCDAELPAVPGRKSDRTLDASLEGAAPFKVVVQVALYKCESCGTEQVLSNKEVGDNAAKALAHGFKAEDIHP